MRLPILLLLISGFVVAQNPPVVNPYPPPLVPGPGTGGTCAGLAGDVTGTCAANTVVKVNGGSIPNSQAFVGTNSSGQVVAAVAGPLPSGTTATTQSANDNSTKVATTAYVDSVGSGIKHGLAGAFGSTASGASALTASQTVYSVAPAGFTIAECEITTVPADTATFKVWRIASPGTAVPTVANTINTSGIAISTGSLLRTTTLSDFTSLVIAAEDVLAINLSAVGGTATYASFACHN